MRWALRRPYRHGAGRAPSAAAGVGAVPLLHGPEPLEPADRGRTRLERLGRAGHDGAAAPWPGRKAAGVRLEGEVEIDEVYVVAGHKGQPAAVAKRGGSDAVAGWQV